AQPVSAKEPNPVVSAVTAKTSTLSVLKWSASTAAHSFVQVPGANWGLKYGTPSSVRRAITASRHLLSPQVPNKPTVFFNMTVNSFRFYPEAVVLAAALYFASSATPSTGQGSHAGLPIDQRAL